LPDQEPLKWAVRNSILDLVKDIFLLKTNYSNNFSIFDDLNYGISEIISYLDLLKNTGFISEMNHRILRAEIVNLSKFIEPKYDLINSPESNFSDDFFDIPEPLPQEIERELTFFEGEDNLEQRLLNRKKALKDIYKGQDKRHVSFNELSFKGFSGKSKNNAKDKGVKNKRKETIIGLIKDKKEVTIKDITSSIKDFSEKTLQRDLVSLVKEGVLKREGERRWSKYKLS